MPQTTEDRRQWGKRWGGHNKLTQADTHKRCPKCGVVKLRSAFYKSNKYNSSRCKECMAEDLREQRSNPNNKDRFEQYGYETRARRLYGLEPDEYVALVEKQDGKCAICGADKPSAKDRRLHIDHDHETNRVRGLLCNNCNNGLGRFKDRADLLRFAAEYLDPTPEYGMSGC